MYNPYSLFYGKTVLVVDDSYVSNSIVKNLLERNGVHVLLADSSKEALHQFVEMPEFSINAVLISLCTPLVDGFDACIKIRHSGRSDSELVPVIALITSTDERSKQRCIDSGMTDFLTQPVEPDKLLRTLSLYVD